ncbi:TrmB family transcriptional regulator [Candidatus Woesearchaeota archaeon]|nr:TrmB family transcriptional regulator [Candidatus Woesearchaeota archaeon]
MIEELKELGLTGGEAKVYLAMLGLGSTTVGPIVKKSGISYSKIYEVLQRLINKGLVGFIIKEKTKYFQAVEPRRLYEFLEKQEAQLEENKEKLNKIIPRLEQLKEPAEREEASIFIGFKGIRTAYEVLLANAKKSEPVLFFYVYSKEYAEEVDNFYRKLFVYFKKINIKFKGITLEDFKKSHFMKNIPDLIEARFVKFPLPSNVDICQDRVLQIAFDKKPIAVLIHSQEIADNYRLYFNNLWRIAKP